MLGRERAAEAIDDVVDAGVGGVLVAREEVGGLVAFGRLQVVVQVAVAQVPEGDVARAGHDGLERGVGGGDEVGQRRQRHRDVVLDVEAFDALRERDRLAQLPQRARLQLVARDGDVDRLATLDRRHQRGLGMFAQHVFVVRRREIDQHRPQRLARRIDQRQRRTQRGEVALDEGQRRGVHRLVAHQLRVERVAQSPHQRHGVAQRAAGGPRGDAGARLREQAQGRGGDDAERALAADEQVAQVVAGVVLAKAVQAAPELALRGHDLQPQAQLARVAEAQHLRAAGVGREIAADRARSLGGQAEREQQAGLRGGGLHLLQRESGLDGDGLVVGIDAADRAQPFRGEHDLRA